MLVKQQQIRWEFTGQHHSLRLPTVKLALPEGRFNQLPVPNRRDQNPFAERPLDLGTHREARSVQHDLGVDRLGDMDRAEQVTKQAEITQGG